MSTESKPSEYDVGMICACCKLEEPMYPRKNSNEDCNIYCADCYWDIDAERKRKRRLFWSQNPEAFEAYRKHVAEVLGVKYVPLTKEKNKIESNQSF